MKKKVMMILLLAALSVSVSAAGFSLPDVNEVGLMTGPSFAFGTLDSISRTRQVDYHFTITGADYEGNGFGVGYLLDLSLPISFTVAGESLSESYYNPVMFTGGLSVNYRLTCTDRLSFSLALGLSAGYGIRIYKVSSESEATSDGLIRISAYGDLALRYRVYERMLLRCGVRVSSSFYTCRSTPAFPATAEENIRLSLFGADIYPYAGVSYLY